MKFLAIAILLLQTLIAIDQKHCSKASPIPVGKNKPTDNFIFVRGGSFIMGCINEPGGCDPAVM
jgi:hypothetical protein